LPESIVRLTLIANGGKLVANTKPGNKANLIPVASTVEPGSFYQGSTTSNLSHIGAKDKPMVNTSEFLASDTGKRLPDWLKSEVLGRAQTIDKIFPKLGLTNCSEPVAEDILDYGEKDPIVKKMSVVFSSDGFAGLWDLATMSIRGVSTCMHWENVQHRRGVIGYITEPNYGIIYLTDGTTTEHGLSINKRAIVCYNDYGSEKHITLGTVYVKTTNRDPMAYINREKDETQTKRIFKTFLRSKLNGTRVC